MPAPALVMVAHGSTDPRVVDVAHALTAKMASRRPELPMRCAFLNHSLPAPTSVVEQLAGEDVHEVAFVPLDLAHAVEASEEIGALVSHCRTNYPEISFVASRPVGPELNLLTILDARLRAALAAARVLELDGLVLSADSTGDVRDAALLARRARQWSTHHRLPCLTAVADGSGPSVAQAIAGLRAQGRRHIAVGSFNLTPDELFHASKEQALRLGAVAVSGPIGAADEVVELVLARYAFAAMGLLDFARYDMGFDDLFAVTEPDPAWAVGA